MKPIKLLSAGILLALLLLFGFLLLKRQHASGHILRITQNNQLVEEVDLDTLSTAFTRVITCPEGENQILISKDCVRITNADCPDQICVETGNLLSCGRPVVCLPHKLILELR